MWLVQSTVVPAAGRAGFFIAGVPGRDGSLIAGSGGAFGGDLPFELLAVELNFDLQQHRAERQGEGVGDLGVGVAGVAVVTLPPKNVLLS